MTTDSTTKNRGRMVAGRRRILAGAAALAGAAVLGFPAIRTRAAQTLKVGTYGGYFKDSFDQHIYPDFTKETGIEIEFDRRADRRGLARAAADRGGRRRGPGRRQHDGAGLAPEGRERAALGAARRQQAAQRQESPRALREALSRRQGQQPRGGVLVCHAGHQYGRVSGGADLLEGAVGPRQRGQDRPAGAGQQFVPAGDHRQDLVRRHGHPRAPRRASPRCWRSWRR